MRNTWAGIKATLKSLTVIWPYEDFVYLAIKPIDSCYLLVKRNIKTFPWTKINV